MITQGRRINTAGMVLSAELRLRTTVEHITDLLPVDKIAAVEDRHTRKINKAGCDQVKVLTHAADGRIRIKAGQDGALIHFFF